MPKLMDFKIFENFKEVFKDWDSQDYSEKLATLLYLNNTIKVEPETAVDIITKIGNQALRDKTWEKPVIDLPNVTLPMKQGTDGLRDKLRWSDYLNSIVRSYTIRGFAFEGFIAGLYMGKLTKRGTRADIEVEDSSGQEKKVSLKTMRDSSESPTLANIRKAVTDTDLEILIGSDKDGVVGIFKKVNMREQQNRIWDLAFGKVDYFMVIYFEGKVKNKPDTRDNILNFRVISSEDFKNYIIDGTIKLTTSRQGSKDKFQLRPNKGFHNYFPIKFSIMIPEISEEELESLYDRDLRDWARRVFGDDSSRKIRTETLQDLYDKRGEILQKISTEELVRPSKKV